MKVKNRSAWPGLTGILLCAWFSGVSCAPSGYEIQQTARPVEPRIGLWAVPGELRIDPITGRPKNPHVAGRDWSEQSTIWSRAEKRIRLAGARNEWVGFQLIVEAAGDNLKYVNVSASDLTGPGGEKISARSAKLFRVWYTEVTEPSRILSGFNAMGLPSLGTGFYGDALIPFHVRGWGAPFAVPKGRNQAVYVDLKIPKNIPAGVYKGTITVKADRARDAAAEVELTVWDFDIPDKLNARAEGPLYRATIPGAFGVGSTDELNLKLERQYFRMCREHRMIGYIYDCFPKLEGKGKDITIDWAFHDKRFGPYFDGTAFDDRVPLEHWNVPVDTYWPGPRGADAKDPDLYYGRIESVLKQYDQHFKEKGWNPRMYVFFQGLDEPSQQAQFVKIKKLAETVHRSSKRIKMRHDFYTAFGKPEPLLEYFGDSMDIWCISGCFYPVKLLQAEQAKGKEAWFYQGSEPWIGSENLDNEALGLRTWAWIGWKYGVDCWHNWCSGRWGGENLLIWPNNSGTRQYWRPNHNGVMMFPGKCLGVDEIFPSIRLKAYRRGNTDYEYFVLLKALGAGAKADEIVNSIIRKALGEAGNNEALIGKFGDWSHDPDEWEKARPKLAEAILAARAKKPG